jgi:DDE superfamily endonuclease
MDPHYAIDTRPKTLLECRSLDGTMNYKLYTQYQNRERDELFARSVAQQVEWDRIDSALKIKEASKIMPKEKATRERHPLTYAADDGERLPYTYCMSNWYRHYIDRPQTDNPKFQRVFRRRFRLPYDCFLELLDMVKADDRFTRWTSHAAIVRSCAPISLLLLGTLRYLGRGWTFDDLDEATAISQDVHRVFFHRFIDFGSTNLFAQFVTAPATAEDVKANSIEYAVAGFHGAVGSTDATHIVCERLHQSIAQQHMSHKSPHPCRSYNLTCNHRRRILSTTRGFPARWNDKTIVRFDKFVTDIHDGFLYDDVMFRLYETNGDGVVVERAYRGAWLLVDNGYLKWSVTVPPTKLTTSKSEMMFSEWLESMRKDVECTFGILKGRWRVLKTGIRVHGPAACDMIWLTCCALHNMLLERDGLATTWERGTPSEWEGILGEHSLHDIPVEVCEGNANLRELIEFDCARLGRHTEGYDESYIASDSTTPGDGHGDGHGDGDGDGDGDNDGDNDGDGDMDATMASDGDGDGDSDGDANMDYIRDELDELSTATYVRKLSQDTFKQRLVKHFAICVAKGEVRWPTRLRDKPYSAVEQGL